jgi:hypothetical protein
MAVNTPPANTAHRMNTFVNLVATRCKNGDHAALFRWYNDHVHILMRFDGLLRATLYRRATAHDPGGSAAAPEYFCLYDFATQADFMAFEVNDAREQARQVLLAGWGKEGIEITQRRQFWRLGARLTCNAMAASDGLWHVQLLQLGAGPLEGVARWLGDCVHRGLDPDAVGHQAWHRAADATDAGGDALVVAQTASTQALAPSAWQPGWWPGDGDDGRHSAWGQAPATSTVTWQAPYRRLCSWRR